MASTKQHQYKGSLSPVQIAHGMNAAIDNARRLAEDAKLLLDEKRYPTAFAVAVLSIEESGKVSILRHFAFGADKKNLAQLWKDYRSHRSKNAAWILPQLVAAGARNLDSLRLATDTKAEHTAVLDQLKQISLYTDCLGEGNWSEPRQVIDDKLASYLVDVANLLVRRSPITAKEIELWQEYMAPLYGAPLKEMKAGLLDWLAAMKQSGLWTDGNLSAEDLCREGQSSSLT